METESGGVASSHGTAWIPNFANGSPWRSAVKSNYSFWKTKQNLVGGLEHEFYFSIQLGIIIPADELIFFRGVGIPPTRNDCPITILGSIDQPCQGATHAGNGNAVPGGSQVRFPETHV